tara:strand:+ start:6090 stop:8723 length:2634 start_codon:yes stop_codon:yes gene_type:complete
MNKPLKYSLITLALTLLAFCIFITAILSIIYSKGLSLDSMSGYVEKRISNYSPGSNLKYKEAILKYNEKNGLYIEANKLIYFDSNTDNTFDIDSLWINFDFLSLWNNENKNIQLDLEKLRIVDPESSEIGKFIDLSINIENENLIRFNIDKAAYKSANAAISIDYLSAEIRNQKDTILNIKNFNYDNSVSNVSLNLDSSLIRLNIDSVLNDKKSNFYVRSRLTFENQGGYNVEAEFHQDDDKLIIHEFIGDDIYLTEQGIIDLLEGLNKVSVKLNFRAKAGAFNRLISYRSDLDIQSFIDGFIGWQNFNINAVFNLNNGNYETVNDSSLLLSGIYDFRKIDLPDSFYSQLKDSTIYDMAILKKKDSYDFKINNLKNDFIQLNSGSELILSDNLDYSFVTLVTSFKKDLILDYIKGSLSEREANNNKLYDFLNRNLYSNQDVILSFELVPNSENIIQSIRNVNVYSKGKFDSNYIFDDNKNPNYIIGIIDYQFSIEDLKSEDISIKGELNLNNTEAFVRQINLKKKKSEKLILNFYGNFKNLEDSIFILNSVDSDYDIKGEVKISSTNHLFVNNFKIDNKNNVNLIMSGDLSERVLNLDIAGSLIDLSQNKVEVSNKKKEYYLDIENYNIRTNNVIFNGNVKVDNFKAGIVKKKSKLSVHSSATFENHKLSYSREKNDATDTNIIISDDIAHFVGDSHAAKKLLSDGSIEFTSIRDIKNNQAKVNIKLDDFVLIDTPVSLKLLSIPSISGLVSIAEGEPGVRFGYGEIKYTETEDMYSSIEAFAVSDSLGLVMDGNINRKKKSIDMKGEISPMHLVNAIIQKLPIIGNILVGGEGEGMFSIDFTLTGDQDDPDVDSVPLSIIKPRIIERAVELVETSN